MKGIGLFIPCGIVICKALGNPDRHIALSSIGRVVFSKCERSTVCEHTARDRKGAQVQFPVAQSGDIGSIDFGLEAKRPLLSAPFMSRVGYAGNWSARRCQMDLVSHTKQYCI